ncbi:MAG: putative flavoprotein CzcO associated with the cation diffusion facilitator CzcD [Enterovirga sp.]|nr:putative flavoprotein CzcO associated with the cation diffusion facilitator CzcD [Enterovirga sp.]
MAKLPPELRQRRFAVIGAGVAGLCAAKYLLQAGFSDVTIFEIGTQIGGIWCYENDNGKSSAYQTLHINSAKNITHFHDFPFRPDVQLFPSHKDMHEYLVSYAEHFDLVRRIRFRTPVASVKPSPRYTDRQPEWELTTEAGEVHVFDSVIVASGHLSTPLDDPKLKAEFGGQYLHTHYYREPRPFVGKRVCIVGAGNSACDIASDICMTAARTVLVARSGVLIAPKLIFGRPFTDFTILLDREWFPDRLRRWIISSLISLFHGRMTDLGFKPLTSRAHSLSNAVLVQHLAYRRVTVKHGIRRVEGRTIEFEDGTREEFDTLIGGTGYRYDIPFLAEDIVPTADNKIELYKRIVPPDWRGLYMIGFLNTTTSLPNAFEHQMRWLLPLLTGEAALPSPAEMRDDIAAKQAFIARSYYASARHTIEEPHMVYLPELRKSRRALMKRAAQARH